MEACAKEGEPFQHACWGLREQRSQLKAVKLHLAGVMKGLRELFEETLDNRWPEFSFRKRTVSKSPETLEKEFQAFWFGPWPRLPTNPPSRKTSSQSALSGSRRKASSQKIAAGSPRVPNAEGDLDPPQPQPEV